MKQVVVGDFESWRRHAREFLRSGLASDTVHFVDAREGQLALDDALDDASETVPVPGSTVTVPREFLALGKTVARFRDPRRWNLLYRALWRVTHGEPHLLRIVIDPDVSLLRSMEKAVHHDIHKMRAFVRFREIRTDSGPEYVAWHRPDHFIVAANAPFFVRRFGAMRWAILTPDESAFWDGAELRAGPGAPRSSAPEGDALEDLWRTYYGSIFNPARTNLRAMQAEMPSRHWSTLPESRIIGDLLRNADARVIAMAKNQAPSARPWIPSDPTLPVLANAAKTCEGCELFRHATQTVFGEGPTNARVMMVGEQPGDNEDLAGKPFCGPAGQLLDRALDEAGVDRQSIYVTNAVKHFKFEERGKRRIHQKPNGIEISACRPWLEAEIQLIRPKLIVCLGATAAQSLTGRDFRVQRDRGKFLEHRWAGHLSTDHVMGTIHPSALLRMPDKSLFENEYRLFVRDLSLVADYLQKCA